MEGDGYRKDKEMKRLPSRSLKIAAAGAAAVVLGAGGGVAAYAVASGTATQTVVRQVTVTDSQPAARLGAQRERPLRPRPPGRRHDQGDHAVRARLSAPGS